MTGAYIRIKRDDEWQNIEIEHLTGQEREDYFATCDEASTMGWINMLCKEIRDAEAFLKQMNTGEKP